MTTFLKSIAVLIPLSLLVPSQSTAQDEKPAVASYRVCAFGPGEFKNDRFNNGPGGKWFNIHKNHVSNPIESNLREGKFLDFFSEDSKADEAPSFSVVIPANNRNDLLVLLILNGKKIEPQLIDLQKIKIERGGQLVYNLSKVSLAFQCGEGAKNVIIKAGGRELVAAPSADKVIQTIYYPGKDGKPVKLSSSLYFKDPGSRQIVFCFPGKEGGRPKVTPIAIFDPVKKKPAGG